MSQDGFDAMAVMVLIYDHKQRSSNRQAREVSNQQCGLLRLPAELRNYIYSLVLPTEKTLSHFHDNFYTFEPYHTHPRRGEDLSDRVKRCFAMASPAYALCDYIADVEVVTRYTRHMTSLFRTCRQLRAESVSFFYGYNQFVLPISPVDQKWTIRWLKTRPREFYAVTKQIYFSQQIRRCSLSSLKTRERLIYIDLRTFELQVIPVNVAHPACVKRYLEHVEKMKKRPDFVALKVELTRRDEIDADLMIRVAEVVQYGGKSSRTIERERRLWNELPFGVE